MNTEIPAALAGERVDRVVSMLMRVPRREAASLVARGAVHLAGRPVASRSQRVEPGDVLGVDRTQVDPAPALPSDAGVAFTVVHADDEVIVVDKPAGLVVHPGAGRTSGTLANGLIARFPEIAAVGQRDRPGLVHRLDAGTSGLLVVARTAGAYRSLVDQLAVRGMDRRYLTLVRGRFDALEGKIDAPIGRSATRRTTMAVTAGGRAARTSFVVLAQYDEPERVALLECRLSTGRTHQIRVHLAAIGHPVVGDVTYDRQARSSRLMGTVAARPFLHAHRLTFDSPTSGRPMSFSSPLPSDLEEVHERLR